MRPVPSGRHRAGAPPTSGEQGFRVLHMAHHHAPRHPPRGHRSRALRPLSGMGAQFGKQREDLLARFLSHTQKRLRPGIERLGLRPVRNHHLMAVEQHVQIGDLGDIGGDVDAFDLQKLLGRDQHFAGQRLRSTSAHPISGRSHSHRLRDCPM